MASILSAAYFHDEQAAYDFVEARIWANGRPCPHCGVIDRSGPLKGSERSALDEAGKIGGGIRAGAGAGARNHAPEGGKCGRADASRSHVYREAEVGRRVRLDPDAEPPEGQEVRS